VLFGRECREDLDRGGLVSAAMLRPVAWLLHLANADAPTLHRRDFYALKERLLARWGTIVGEDVQRYRRECYGYGFDGCEGKSCRKCGGTGVFSESWVLLERWEFCGYTFHRPVGPTRPRAVDYIDGRIRHEGVDPRASHDALLWLTLLFDRRLFWRSLTSSRFNGWQWRPMLALQYLAFEIRSRVDRLKNWLRVRRCYECERRFIARTTGSAILCRRCERARIAWAANRGVLDDDLPF
jgi:hypothetical protein